MFTPSRPVVEMVDLHMHVIPGVDDGALDLPMALELLRMAREQGIGAVFATPHSGSFRVLAQEIRSRFDLLQQTAAGLWPELFLVLGCEVLCEPGQMERILDALDAGLFPTMNGTAYVLMELSPWGRATDLLSCAEALAQSGYRPILAHAERYPYLQGETGRIDEFRAMGGRIQLNVYSLSEETDPAIRTWAQQLVLTRRADYLGTDAHRTYHRPPRIQAGLDWLYENVDPIYANWLTWERARETLLEGTIC